MPKSTKFTFEISLSVLNHLGRNLYRNFITVIGEAISNSWDAGANNVWVHVDRENSFLVIKDDGDGMSEDDFQNKFLRIGYSKRNDVNAKPKKGRSFIGRKGIGKLALLSCADRITVISKTNQSEYVGGVIDNSGLDKAIERDVTPDKYPLEPWKIELMKEFMENHEKGTIVYFENIKDGIKNSLDFLRKSIALYFRFSVIDSKFKIHFNGTEITNKDLKELVEKTQFLWKINELDDPYIEDLSKVVKRKTTLNIKDKNYKGFISSVIKPRDLKIINIDERVGVDLFVNGRLRERDILKHIPTSRVVENYLYGQIHIDKLDKGSDRFTSSREGIVADDPVYKEMLDNFRSNILNAVIELWDKWRRELNVDGDPDNPDITKKERKAEELFNVVAEDYVLPDDSENKEEVNKWIRSLREDAKFNFTSYSDCFISENLIRMFIEEKKIELTKEALREIEKWQKKEVENKKQGNLSIDIRKDKKNISYLSMDGLANLVDKKDPLTEACLSRDAKEYKPVRDALAHTALLTDVSKRKLTTVYENIKGRIKVLLTGKK